jgi:hypothetical protein
MSSFVIYHLIMAAIGIVGAIFGFHGYRRGWWR